MNADFMAAGAGRRAAPGAHRRRLRAATTLALATTACVQVAPAAAATPIYAQGAAPSFATAASFDTAARSTRAIAAGDLNNDGKPDLATVSQTEGLGVLLATGPGSYGPVARYGAPVNPFQSATFIVAAAISDLDGDGDRDVVAQDARGNVALVWTNAGGGVFGTAAVVELNPRPNCGTSSSNPCSAAFPVDIAVADFNEDAKPDLVTANPNTDNVAVVLGNGDGTFGAASYTGLGGADSPFGLAIADIDGDGHADIAVASSTSATVSVLRGDGHGGFGAATNVDTGIILPNFVEVGDVSSDGKPDIVVTNTARLGKGSVLIADGAGGFAPPKVFDSGSNPSDLALADMNGDRRLDVVISNSTTLVSAPVHSVSVFAGDGGGVLASPVTFGLDGGLRPTGLAVADLDGDGRLDVATANLNSDATDVKDVSVLRNTTPPPSAAGAEIVARVPAYLSLTGGSVDFGSIRPTAELATYFARTYLDVRSTYPGIEVSVGTSSANVNMGGLGEVQVTPWEYGPGSGNWNLFQNIPRPVFASETAANELVPVDYRLQVPGRTVLTKGRTYSEPIVYTATTTLP